MTEEEYRNYIDRYVAERRDEIIGTLLDLLRIPSVGSEGSGGAPFGPEVERALRFVTDKASTFGLDVKNVDGYAVHSETGSGSEVAMALTHVDVVPAGSGWTRNPLGEVADGKVFGRGAQDNKGPTVACLYALKALKESGIPLRRRVRHVVGGNEESGFRCVRHYFEVEPLPKYGFSPDACFPLVYAEKGTMNVRVRALLGKETRAGVEKCRILCLLEEISGGEAANMVPDRARAVLRMSPGAEREQGLVLQRLKEGATKVAEVIGGPGPLAFEFSQEPGRIIIRASGKACHASVPWEGTNAVAAVLHLVASLGPTVQNHAAIRFMANAADIYGRGLDIQCEDDITGKLSCNLGVAGTEELGDVADSAAESTPRERGPERGAREVRPDPHSTGRGSSPGSGSSSGGEGSYGQGGGLRRIWGIYNIRYPVQVSGDLLKSKVLAVQRPEGVEVEVVGLGKPHYTDPNSFLVQTLLRIYREESGDQSPPITIGGGTYAKVIPGGVAYGPVRPGRLETAHQPDEHILIGDLLFLVKVYSRALLALANG
ncbi:MAG TPA: M20 family metallopeptidase [Firmicutes bacterium]|nr:M20 family metallopeptidase [Candidatus Fermentithermobacillaceae bacterium]